MALVAAVFGLITSSWVAVPALVVLVVLLVAGIVGYMRRMVRDPGELPIAEPEAATLRLGEAVEPERVRAALAASLRDAHAQQRGAERFLRAFAERLQDSPEHAAALRELIEEQRRQAGVHARLLEQRLHAIGERASRLAEEEALIGAWLFERVLADGASVNARHAFALAELSAVSFEMARRLAVVAGDRGSEQLLADLQAQACEIAGRWRQAWEAVLEVDVARRGPDGRQATLDLLEQARRVEEMRGGLLEMTAWHQRAAANPAGTEAAGLSGLLQLTELERAAAREQRELLLRRSALLDGRPSALGRWETLAAARAASLVESARSFKVLRDARDVIAAEHLQIATFELLERAARHAGDSATAEMARGLAESEGQALERLRERIEETLEVALLVGE